MLRPSTPAPLRCVLIGALAATLLAGCGRKGPLELPPSAKVAEVNDPVSGKPRPPMTSGGYPIAPPGERKSIPLDWLID